MINYKQIYPTFYLINCNDFMKVLTLLKKEGLLKLINHRIYNFENNKWELVSKIINVNVTKIKNGTFDIRFPVNVQHIEYFEEIFSEYETREPDNHITIWDGKNNDSQRFDMLKEYGFINNQEEIYKELLKRHEKPYIGALEASTGFGKTKVSLELIHSTNYRTAVHFVKFPHLRNYLDDVLKFSNIKEEEIAIIRGEESFGKDYSKCKLFLVMVPTMYTLFKKSVVKNGGDYDRCVNFFLYFRKERDLVYRFYEDNNISMAIFDEAHLSTPSILNMLNSCYFRNTIFMTATYKRTDMTESNIINKLCVKDKLFFETAKRHVTYPAFMTLDKISPNLNEKMFKNRYYPGMRSKRGKINFNKLYNTIVGNKETFDNYMEIITFIIDGCINDAKFERTVLCCSMKIEHLKIIRNALEKIFGEKVGLIIGGLDKQTTALELSRRIIVSTEKSMAGSLNIKNLECIVFPFLSIHNKITLTQIVGRLRGKYGNRSVIIDLYFTDYLFRKFNEKRMDFHRSNSKVMHESNYYENIDFELMKV